MAITQTNKYALLASAALYSFLSFSSVTLAEEKHLDTSIPMLNNATVFADFTDDTPAVLNYFTSATEQKIIDFYQEHFGEATSQEKKRGRLTLTYQQENRTMRVIISQQNNKRQVDVIVEHIK